MSEYEEVTLKFSAPPPPNHKIASSIGSVCSSIFNFYLAEQ